MKRKDSGSVRVWSVLGKASLLILLAAAAFDGRSRAVADGPEPPAPPEDDPIEPGAWEGHIPSTLYADGPFAIPISDVSPEEQAGIHAAGERSNYGASVHAAWSAAVHSIAADAEVQRASHQSGTTGLEDVEVAP